MSSRLLGSLAVIASLLFASACGSKPLPPPPPSKPTVVEVTISADRGINADTRGRPSPLVVRVYELSSLAAFDTADYFALFEKDKETLGSELVMREELHVRPGETQRLVRTMQSATRYLAVVAAFRELERARWRAAVHVPLERVTPVEVQIDKLAVSITAW